MTLKDLFEFAIIGAVDLGKSENLTQLRDLYRRWRREENTDVDLIDFKQAFPT